MATESSEILEPKPDIAVDSVQEMNRDGEFGSERVEIDTSAPFESVKEAANRFGGMGFWKPISHKPASEVHDDEMINIVKVEDQTAQLERDLKTKERETLDVLRELKITKMILEELKLKLQKEASETNPALKENSQNDVNFVTVDAEKENHEINVNVHQNGIGDLGLCASAAPGIILQELKQAKMNLTRTTTDLADIRATVDLYNKKIEKERMSLEKTRQRLSSNTSKISSLEEELNQTRQKLELAKDTAVQGSHLMDVVTRKLQMLSSETELFKKVGKAARSEVLSSLSEIEQTKSGIKTAEIRLVAAKKMKAAARASEALALAEIKALSNSENTCNASQNNPECCVTLTFEEYSSLISRAQEAKEACKGRAGDAMLQVDEANVSNIEILKKVEEVTKEVKISKKALEEALSRVEAANSGKLAVEEALRKWRSEHGQNRRSVHNSTKFKNSQASLHRKESHLLDVNDANLVGDGLKPVLKPTLSIGQILSRKLLLTEEYENGMQAEKSMGKHKVSLGQMLSKPNAHPLPAKKEGKENAELSSKRKKFSFARISLLMTKQNKNKKKKKQTPISMCRST